MNSANRVRTLVAALAVLASMASPANAGSTVDSDRLILKDSNGITMYSGMLTEGANGDLNPSPATVTIGPNTTVTTSDFLLFSSNQPTTTQNDFFYTVGLTEGPGNQNLSDVVIHARYNAPALNGLQPVTYEYWGMVSEAEGGPIYAANQTGVNAFMSAFYATHPTLTPGAGFQTNTYAGSFAETGALQDVTNALHSNQVQVLVASVPEPETYALMLVGLGLVGYASRRRA